MFNQVLDDFFKYCWLYETHPDLAWTQEREERLAFGDEPLPEIFKCFLDSVKKDPGGAGDELFRRLTKELVPDNAIRAYLRALQQIEWTHPKLAEYLLGQLSGPFAAEAITLLASRDDAFLKSTGLNALSLSALIEKQETHDCRERLFEIICRLGDSEEVERRAFEIGGVSEDCSLAALTVYVNRNKLEVILPKIEGWLTSQIEELPAEYSESFSFRYRISYLLKHLGAHGDWSSFLFLMRKADERLLAQGSTPADESTRSSPSERATSELIFATLQLIRRRFHALKQEDTKESTKSSEWQMSELVVGSQSPGPVELASCYLLEHLTSKDLPQYELMMEILAKLSPLAARDGAMLDFCIDILSVSGAPNIVKLIGDGNQPYAPLLYSWIRADYSGENVTLLLRNQGDIQTIRLIRKVVKEAELHRHTRRLQMFHFFSLSSEAIPLKA